MSRNVITVNGDDSIEFVAYHLYKHRVNALPVVDDNNKLCGIIAQNDIFRAFVEIMSMDRSCTRITLEAEDQIGVVAEISNLFKENNINIYSLITRLIGNGQSEITIRADLSGHGLEIVEQLREAGYNVTDIMTIQGVN